MAFMKPEYFRGRVAQIGDDNFVPEDELDVPIETLAEQGIDVDVREGWFARLSAPGYLDCTGWTGPYESRAEAARALSELYDVDSETGDDLEDAGGDAIAEPDAQSDSH